MIDGGGMVSLGALAIALAGVHLVAEKVPFSPPLTRDRWLSAGAGVSIVYVFVYLLPKLAHERASVPRIGLREEPIVFILVFCGLAGFFGLERIARLIETYGSSMGRGRVVEQPVFWLHTAVFAVYNAVIGYMLVSGELIENRAGYCPVGP